MPNLILPGADLVAILVLTAGVYLPRHRRTELVPAFVGVNVGVLAVSMALGSATASVGMGLGLFGVLSIIRLRSAELSQREIAYYFASLALGLLGGIGVGDPALGIGLMVLIVLALAIADHPWIAGRGVRRELVVLDRAVDAYPDPTDPDAIDVFERAITVAGSVALSADRAGLTTRFVSGGGIDLRGPEVATHALQRLAQIELGPSLGEIERDPGEGLGLVVVVTASAANAAWRHHDRNTDPTLTRIGIFTAPGGRAGGPLTVDASTLQGFREHWHRLAGQRGLTRELLLSGAPA